MEYGPEISIFGLKLMMKSGLEKIYILGQEYFQKDVYRGFENLRT